MDKLLDNPLAWGRHLIETRDIDPIYDMLFSAIENQTLRPSQLKRWLIAYWCLYHAGAASFLSDYEGEQFWRAMGAAARNTTQIAGMPSSRWPRATERRHWRGKNAMTCIDELAVRYPIPELMVEYAVDDTAMPAPFERVSKRVREWPSFGPWIAFKVADMLERVIGYPIEFPLDVVMYDSPREGAKEVAENFCSVGTTVADVIYLMTNSYGDYSLFHPGRPNRPCGLQEVETVLCKWKSARGGHYYIGKDLHEIREGMKGWGKTATLLLDHLPPALSDK
jgi:hypothetical protein